MPIHLPPLRERPDDIALLAARASCSGRRRSTARAARRSPRRPARWLQAQPWPGNVRQLRQRSSAPCWSARSDTLDVDGLRRVGRDGPREAAEALPPVGSMTMDEIERAMIVKSLRHHGGNISKVAESLGLSRAALYRRFEKVRDPV